MAPKISPDTTTHVEEDTSSPISQPSPSVSVMNADKSSLVSSTSESSAMKNQSEEDRHYQKTEPMEWLGVLVWPCMLFLPLLLSSQFSFTSYKKVFPSEWYIYDYESGETPKPLGLTLGIVAVAIGQIFVIFYFFLHSHGYFLSPKMSKKKSIQKKGAPQYNFLEGVQTQLSQPEGFLLLVGYLAGTWMFRLMPPAYYNFDGQIQYTKLIACLVCQDFIQFIMHRLEHVASPAFYRLSHKPHHKFTNPRLFDAFNGSTLDTIFMILIPLYSTANLIRGVNVWTYMAFGSIYANWLTLIHSEFPLPWDKAFRLFGLGTAGDHNVHHKFFKYNFGHLFMWFDQICGTYQHPEKFVPRVFNPEV